MTKPTFPVHPAALTNPKLRPSFRKFPGTPAARLNHVDRYQGAAL